MTPGVSYLKSAVAEAVKLEATRAQERSAEDRRRELPFPGAVDPDRLVTEDRLVDITILCRTAVVSTSALRGFRVPVYASAAAGEAMLRLGVEPVVAACWWCCHRENLEDGVPRTGGTSRAVPFLASGAGGAESWFCYQSTQRPDGRRYGVIFCRDETNPTIPSGASGGPAHANA